MKYSKKVQTLPSGPLGSLKSTIKINRAQKSIWIQNLRSVCNVQGRRVLSLIWHHYATLTLCGRTVSLVQIGNGLHLADVRMNHQEKEEKTYWVWQPMFMCSIPSKHWLCFLASGTFCRLESVQWYFSHRGVVHRAVDVSRKKTPGLYLGPL